MIEVFLPRIFELVIGFLGKHKERVIAHLGTVLSMHMRCYCLTLEVVNMGMIPIYLKQIALANGNESNRIGDIVERSLFQPDPSSQPPLQPGEGRKFVLPVLSPNQIAFGPKTKVWISVTSAKSEIKRLKGKLLDATLADLARSVAAYHTKMEKDGRLPITR